MKESLIWGKIALKNNSNYEFIVQNKHLLLTSSDDLVSFKVVPSGERVDQADTHRIVGKTPEINILPVLSDRPLVLRPKTNLTLLPATTYKFYVYLPATFQLFAGGVKEENKIFEYPQKELSSTWFGETTEGELCYALYTSFDTTINEEKKGDNFVICPIEISNNSKESLEIKRLAVRGVHLSIYANNELMISNKVKIKYNGFESLSDIQFAKSATSSIPHLKQIAAPRIPENNTILKRSFQLIRHITQY